MAQWGNKYSSIVIELKLFQWKIIVKGAISDMHQAIDVLGFPNPGCSKGVFDKDTLTASLNLDLRPDILLGGPGGIGIQVPDFAPPILPTGPNDVPQPPAPKDLFAVGNGKKHSP